jgi:hypothetical protein
VFFGYSLLALLWTVMTMKTFVTGVYLLSTDLIWFSKMFSLQQPLNSSCLYLMKLLTEPSCLCIPLCAALRENRILFGSIVYGLFSPLYCLFFICVLLLRSLPLRFICFHFYTAFFIWVLLLRSPPLRFICFLPLTFVPLSNKKIYI